MKIAMNWLAEYMNKPLAAQVAAEALTHAGLPVEHIDSVAGTDVIDVEVTSNRSDCLSHIGVARELATLLKAEFRMPQTACRTGGTDVHSQTSVTIDETAGCPCYTARLITGVKIGPSPEWLRARIESLGMRSVNNVVDVTNFILMEMGQPLHTFDFDTLGEKRIVVRRAKKGEKIISIDGKENSLDASMLVIADAHKPVAVAGVMGGKETEVTERTVNVLLEAARFDPLTIRSQARALTLMSDSSYRFERAIDPALVELASSRAAALIQQVAGGTIQDGVICAGNPGIRKPEATLRLSRIRDILGIEIATERAVEILTSLGFSPVLDGGTIKCVIPGWRQDVEREIDLIEEVARVHGYQHIPTLDRVVHSVQPRPVDDKAKATIRNAILAAGFNETINVTFVSEAEATLFLSDRAGTSPLRVSDAVRKASNVLRPSLLPSLLAARRTNQNAGAADARLFEVAQTFWQPGNPAKDDPAQQYVLALIGNDLAEVKGAIELAISRLLPNARVEYRPVAAAWYVSGGAAQVAVFAGGTEKILGTVGLFSPDVQKQYDLRHAASGAELNWDMLVALFAPVRTAKPLPKFPGVTRDLSVVVDEATRWGDVEKAVAGSQLQHLQQVAFVTTFRHKSLGQGKKSLTMSLEFRDPAATLKSEQVDSQMKLALDMLSKQFGAALRA